jgi:acyl carrier protein
MSNTRILELAKDMLGESFSEDKFNVPIAELRIDSLDFMEFIMAIEEKFEIEIDGEKIDESMGLSQFFEIVNA